MIYVPAAIFALGYAYCQIGILQVIALFLFFGFKSCPQDVETHPEFPGFGRLIVPNLQVE